MHTRESIARPSADTPIFQIIPGWPPALSPRAGAFHPLRCAASNHHAGAQHGIHGLVTLGIDEISYSKGHKYATIVYDLDRSCVVWVGKGKQRDHHR